MTPVPLPSVTPDDDAYLGSICTQYGWTTPHRAPWLAAYNQYRAQLGNPWGVVPTTFSPDIGDEQYDLYDRRRSTRRIKSVRNTPNLLCCPMCGSGMTGSLDHFLPREEFPEFSVMLANLVPTCSACNSSAKGQTYRGTNPESFIHPYFENLAASPIWQIEAVPPLDAATFKPTALATLQGANATRVSFHLQHILGTQFHLWAGSRWSTLPQLIRNAVGGTGLITSVQVQAELSGQLGQANASTGTNSWHSAFFRGLRNDGGVHAFVAAAATPLTAIIPA